MFRTKSGLATFARKCLTLAACLVAAATCAVAASPPAAQEKAGQPNASAESNKAKADLHGDALPQGALARLGTLRWRHADTVSFAAFLPDGKAVLTAGLDNTIRLWERETGKEIRRFAVPATPLPARLGAIRVLNAWGAGRAPLVVSLAPDGKILAVLGANNTIQVWEVATGKELRTIPAPQNGVATLLFAPDSKTLAAAGGDRTIYLLDADTGKEIRQLKAKQPMGGMVRIVVGGVFGGGAGSAFSPDGKALATSEQELDQAQGTVNGYVKITDMETGNELRRIDILQSGASTIAYSPDNKVLAFASGNVIQLREPDTGKEIRQIGAPAGATAMLFAPNSKILAVKGSDQMIQLIETESGRELHKLGAAAGIAANNFAGLRFGGIGSRDLAFSADGKTIASGSGNTLRMWDTATGKERPLSEGHRGPVSAVNISSDAKTLISRGADNVMRRWDVNTAEELGHFREPQGTLAVAISPDGRTIAFGTNDAQIRLHDAATGKEMKKLKGHANGTASIVFSPNGKTLASHGLADNTIRLHDPIEGIELRQIVLQTNNPAPGGGFVVRGGYLGGGALTLTFSADSRTLLAQQPANLGQLMMAGGQPQPTTTGTTVRMWDVATGKDVRKFTLPSQHGVGSIALSPDGRILATENADQTISLWEIASGKERRHLGKPAAAELVAGTFLNIGGNIIRSSPMAPASTSTLAFSPDGTLLACKGPGHSIRMWEVADTKEVGQFKGHGSAIAAVAFTPDGKTLATGSNDTTVLLWNVAGLHREPTPPAVELQPADLTALWTDLIGDDAGKAYQGILKLTRASKQTLPLLRDRVKPAVPVDPKKVAKLIADLDSEDFDQRSAGAEELEKLGDLAVPALQNVLTGQPTLETRRRVEQLLARLTGGALTPEQIRLVRAVEVLERTATPEARQLLNALADGAPGALATRQAQAVLSRLGK
jgi:WD40 repeat protein